MTSSVYTINKGINKSLEFKGLKAQYIWYFGGVVVGLLIVFAIMYIMGINTFICLGIILTLGTVMTLKIFRLSHQYGRYGMMKKLARRAVPKVIKTYSRKVFMPNSHMQKSKRTKR